MAVTLTINGTALFPQPRTATWQLSRNGSTLAGTDSLGAYDVLVLQSPPMRGGTLNWTNFENQTLTSIIAPARGQSMKSGSGTTYSSGVVSKPIVDLSTEPGDIVGPVEMMVMIVT